MNKLELLKEAHKRGILPENKKPLFDEAVKRGLIRIEQPKEDKNLLVEGAKTFFNTLTGAAEDAKEVVAPSDVEDLPELSTISGIPGSSFQLADTPEGMLNIVNSQRRAFREHNPDVDSIDTLPLALGQDKFGNPVAVDSDGNKFHFNKPGVSLNDVDFVKKGVDKFAPLIAGGAAAAPLGFAKGSLTSALSGVASETTGQAMKESQGAGEGFDAGKIAKTGALAGLGELGGRVIAGLLGRVFSRLGATDDISQYVTPEGKLTDKSIKLLNKNQLDKADLNALLMNELKKRGDEILTPEQARRFNNMKSEGFEPTKAHVTQSANDFRAQQELAKVNKDVQQRLDINNARSSARVPELVEKTGAVSKDGSSVVSAISNKRLEMDKQIGNIYTKIRETNPDKAIIETNRFVNKLKNTPKTDINKGVLESVTGELQRLGIIGRVSKPQQASIQPAFKTDTLGNPIKNKGKIKNSLVSFSGAKKEQTPIMLKFAQAQPSRNDMGAILKSDLLGFTGQQTKKLTPNQAEDLRIFLNSLHDPKNPNIANSLIRDLKDTLDIDVSRAGGKDFFNQARKLKIAERKEFASDANKIHKFDRGSKNILDDITSGKIEPEKFTDKIISKNTTSRDISTIKKSLTSGTDEQIEAGTQAWNDLRGEILERGFDKATKKKGELGPKWDRDAWRRYIDVIGPKKMKELFTGEERAFLNRLKAMDDLQKPIAGTGLGEGPSTLTTNKLIQVMGKFPTGRAAIGAMNALDDAAKPVLDAATAHKMLNPAESTIEALRAYSESVRRGASISPRLGVAAGASESR